MRSTAFFEFYKICILLHRCNFKISGKHRFEKTAIFVKIQQQFCKCCKICKHFAKFQELLLDNLVGFEKCYKKAYLLAKIGADTAENERNFAEKLATERLARALALRRRRGAPGAAGGVPLFFGSALQKRHFEENVAKRETLWLEKFGMPE